MSNRKIFRQVARQYGITLRDVRQGVGQFIEATYNNDTPTAHVIREYCPTKNGKPTPNQYISFLAGYTKSRMSMLPR